MKKLLTIAMMVASMTAFAQKKSKDFETSINTATPTFAIILESKDAEGNDLGMLEIQIVDRKNQLASVKMQRLIDEAKQKSPIEPMVKLIHLPEIDLRTYKIAESMEEVKMAVDNEKVLLVRYLDLIEAIRIKYE